MNSADQQLESLLRETPAEARIRQQNAFDEAASGRRQIVIFGAGHLGRSLLQGLKGTDLEVVGFADNNPRLWGATLDGLSVLSPQDAALRHKHNAIFVVTVWNQNRSPVVSALLDQLRALGCQAVAFPLLFWRHSSKLLPHFFWDTPETLLQRRNDIAAAYELMSDDLSRQAFASQLQLRLHGDFHCIGTPSPGDQYFPQLFSTIADECFVDCGAFTGDTVQSFLLQPRNGFRKVIAVEADPANFNQLTKWIATLDAPVASKITALNAAVGSRRGQLRFQATGNDGARLATDGNMVVECIPIDELAAEAELTFIKMDIEGAEFDALEGARSSIQTHQPILSICIYHRPYDLWRVPLFISSIVKDYQFFLRPHYGDGWESVCYAVPRKRQLKLANSKPRTFAATNEHMS